MAHKEPRVECKIYLRPEERDHLKEVAKENEVSLSDLIRRTVLKKYPIYCISYRLHHQKHDLQELFLYKIYRRVYKCELYFHLYRSLGVRRLLPRQILNCPVCKLGRVLYSSPEMVPPGGESGSDECHF